MCQNYSLKKNLYWFIWVYWVLVVACGIFSASCKDLSLWCEGLLHSRWDLSSLTRDWTYIPCIARQSLNHWTAREGSQKLSLVMGQQWFIRQEPCLKCITENLPHQCSALGAMDQTWCYCAHFLSTHTLPIHSFMWSSESPSEVWTSSLT